MQDSCQNVLVGIKTPLEEHREKARNRQWAEAAWQQVVCSHASSKHAYSEDYAQGFKDGFAEYLFRGGDGEPPLVAPLRYRDARYQNEQGYHAVQDWFAGYRHGAAMARDSGARRWITGPSSLQADLDALRVHEEPQVVDRPGPEKAPTTIPLPQPKILPRADQVSNEPVPAPATTVEPNMAVTEPMPQVAPKADVEQAAIEPAPAVEPDMAVTTPMKIQLDQPHVKQTPAPLPEPAAPLPEALRLQIRRITEATQTGPGPVIINGTPDEAKIRITGIHDAPPIRARITEIMATPQKD